jgi:uncharacterized membrane protein YoaK (UPF0700 family)
VACAALADFGYTHRLELQGTCMPSVYFRQLTARERSHRSNQHLARYLAFVAGAINAGGFLAVKQYTSHMSGIVSSVADNVVVWNAALVAAGLGALLAFLAGAISCAFLVNWSRRRHLRGEYALPLLLEALLLVGFGLLGQYLQYHAWVLVPATVSVLCFVMGLQNAIITKLSNAEIRTTHMTGMITDIGIELGKLLYHNRNHAEPAVLANRAKLSTLSSLVGLFFAGGVIGAFGFKYVGYMSALPLAGILICLAALPVLDDIALRFGPGK